MKTTPSRYILVAEILTIILFHAVKIRQAEKHPSEIVFTQALKIMPFHPPTMVNKPVFEYLRINLIK